MPPRNTIMEYTKPNSDEDKLNGFLAPGEITPAITEETHAQKRPKTVIVWKNVMLMGLLHLSALYSLVLLPQAHPLTWVWGVFYYYFSAVGVTAGCHRLWSHKSYKAKSPLRLLLAVMQSAAMQNHIFEWVRDHRVHHKYTETDADPHNARRGFIFSHIGWLLVRKHPDVSSKGKNINLSDLYADRIVMLQKKIYKPLALTMCFVVPTLVPWYFWGESLFNAYMLAGVLRYVIVLNATWSVNSIAHMWGTRPYDKSINPTQNGVVVLSAAGEGFHNYHHVFPYDYSASEHGWYFNVTTMFIDLMAFVGQVSDRRKVPSDVIQKRKERTGDPSL